MPKHNPRSLKKIAAIRKQQEELGKKELQAAKREVDQHLPGASQPTIRTEVMSMYLYGHTIKEISEKYDISPATLTSWVKKYKWDNLREEVLVDVHREGIRPFANKASMLSRQGIEILTDQLKKLQLSGKELKISEMKALTEMIVNLYKIGNIEQGKPTEITQQQSMREMKLELKKIIRDDPFQEFIDVTPEPAQIEAPVESE